MIIMYSTGCPKCEILKEKLDAKEISYDLVTDVEEMKKLGITKVPMLSVDGNLMQYRDAVKWVNNK